MPIPPLTVPSTGDAGQFLRYNHGAVTATWEPAVEGTGISHIVKLTQSAYDALPSPSTTTLYVIVG